VKASQDRYQNFMTWVVNIAKLCQFH
jgi:hypothetical protein